MSSVTKTSKKAYKRHAYSGPRKSLKKVRAGLRGYYGEVSCRSEVWRSEEKMKKTVKEESKKKESFCSTENKKPRTYARQQKIGLETTYSAPDTSTTIVKAEPLEINWPQADPLEINWPPADPETDPFQLNVETVTKKRLSRISGYNIVYCRPETCDTIDIDEAKSSENSLD